MFMFLFSSSISSTAQKSWISYCSNYDYSVAYGLESHSCVHCIYILQIVPGLDHSQARQTRRRDRKSKQHLVLKTKWYKKRVIHPKSQKRCTAEPENASVISKLQSVTKPQNHSLIYFKACVNACLLLSTIPIKCFATFTWKELYKDKLWYST